jgi:hypothetical protein
MTVRNEHRRSCEILFAFCKSESSMEIVVLMHQSMSILHHDAKRGLSHKDYQIAASVTEKMRNK